jgi:hypothetical protein
MASEFMRATGRTVNHVGAFALSIPCMLPAGTLGERLPLRMRREPATMSATYTSAVLARCADSAGTCTTISKSPRIVAASIISPTSGTRCAGSPVLPEVLGNRCPRCGDRSELAEQLLARPKRNPPMRSIVFRLGRIKLPKRDRTAHHTRASSFRTAPSVGIPCNRRCTSPTALPPLRAIRVFARNVAHVF